MSRYTVAEILLKLALNTSQSINHSTKNIEREWGWWATIVAYPCSVPMIYYCYTSLRLTYCHAPVHELV